ncbi:hypothetical protein KK083_15505 [Fulvivirgaceae bacterium PWU4]|uniref:Uncharacterized protein n=1 Tax=Chryseosolibacter histidini TaxID=2782349 RepID=A0AAP2DNE8_9BACT|nr:hypothetical protein [Chryseosolibacter histidini]MBT1698297.1 hypothetical protein [Chryseosolibacter histidini]
MLTSYKTAWLIGLYNNDLEHRIKNLGYKLTRFYPDLNFDNKTEEPPLLIAFSEDQFSDPENIEKLRDMYPKTVMIKLPLYPPSDHPSYHNPSQNSARHAVIRLIMKINELENRWDN